MIKIDHIQIYGWEAAMRGLRNPMNSWDRSDSTYDPLRIGERDLALMRHLANTGNDHGKFLRMITVTMDITAPLYWWKEADTYKVGTVTNSCSTMHKIHSKSFERSDFSHDHLNQYNYDWLDLTIERLNHERDRYNASERKDKDAWWQMIQMLPTSYNQRRTVQLNYAVLRNMYHGRKNHKLSEWRDFCANVEFLPYAQDLIIGR